MCHDVPQKSDARLPISDVMLALDNTQTFVSAITTEVVVMMLNIIQHALITRGGYVINSEVCLAPKTCTNIKNVADFADTSDAVSFYEDVPIFEQVFALRNIDFRASVTEDNSACRSVPLYYVTQLSPYISTIKNSSQTIIHIHHISDTDLNIFLKLLNITGISRKVIRGPLRAHTLYTPVPLSSEFLSSPPMFNTQLLSEILLDATSREQTYKTYPHVAIRNTILLLSTDFNHFREIEAMLQINADKNNLTVAVLHENNSTLHDILVGFNSALLVVGLHTPLMSYMLASPPGLFVLEGVESASNLCYLELSLKLGHQYNAISHIETPMKELRAGHFEMSVRAYIRHVLKNRNT